jgi:hypothetical protein
MGPAGIEEGRLRKGHYREGESLMPGNIDAVHQETLDGLEELAHSGDMGAAFRLAMARVSIRKGHLRVIPSEIKK